MLVSSIAGVYGDKNIAGYAADKDAMIGLANTLALEGAEHGVIANCLVPAARTRLAEGRDTHDFPPWGVELVAPAVGWLAHEACTASSQLFVSLTGRMATAHVPERPGIYPPEWTIEEIAGRLGKIEDRSRAVAFKPLPRASTTISATASIWRARLKLGADGRPVPRATPYSPG